MKKSTMLLIAGSIAAATLAGCAGTGYSNEAPASSPRSGSSYSDPLLTIKPDVYGMGVGSDQYGRPVKIVPAH